MPARYVDQVQKLDIRSMMAAALKAGPSEHYNVYQDGSGWHAATDPQVVSQARDLVAYIKLDRSPAKGAARGQILLTVFQRDGRSCEQALWLRAEATPRGRTRWVTLCPCSHQSAQTLYFDMGAQQFVSRQAAGLKYRRTVRKVRNYRARMFAIMRELETTHPGPAIPKPVWMAEALYEDLTQELVEMHIRRMCAALKRPTPRFWDEPPFDYAKAKPERVNYPPSTMLFCTKKGRRQLKAKYRQRYGLPTA